MVETKSRRREPIMAGMPKVEAERLSNACTQDAPGMARRGIVRTHSFEKPVTQEVYSFQSAKITVLGNTPRVNPETRTYLITYYGAKEIEEINTEFRQITRAL
jgi:hypothetical protein